MFDASTHPRLFASPMGVDFPKALVAGLLQRLQGHPPEALARVILIVNTRRMARRVTRLLAEEGARLLPGILTLAELSHLPGAPVPGPPPAPLRRRLELRRLIAGLIRSDPGLAPAEVAFDLADSLSALIDEMHGEGVSAADILSLDVPDQSGHWARTRQFIGIAKQYLDTVETAPDAEAARRALVKSLAQTWASAPPDTPILIAGSTGSRGTTAVLMQAIAHLPQGAVILPGFDFDAPLAMWGQLDTALTGEDHPQFRFVRLMQRMGLSPEQVARWTDDAPAVPDRARLVSLALRPAPFTDAWLDEGPQLGDPARATDAVTLIEAQSTRDEALAIALCLRSAMNAGKTAALITPDRMLTRQVTAALDRWAIVPDDSAGVPLHLSPPGRLLRQVAELMAMPARNETLVALLKHPLAHSGAARGDHLRFTRDLELHIRKTGYFAPEQIPFETLEADKADSDWTGWVQNRCLNLLDPCQRPARAWTERLIAAASAISTGHRGGEGALWKEGPGRMVRDALAPLASLGPDEFPLSARDFLTVLDHILRDSVVREQNAPDERIMIWGTLEARVQGADVIVLGGLNEGAWPEAPAPDPWLNRVLRDSAGLLLPERRIGLSAHDWQQAINAPDVFLTRSLRSDEAETVPSRWLNRLTNLLAGLTRAGGSDALAAMRSRGAHWLQRAAALETSEPVASAPRPSPKPPAEARPVSLSVTEIKSLIRDPYAIYAKYVLRLRPLNPLVAEPGALLRGTVIHSVMNDAVTADATQSVAAFLDIAAQRIARDVPWPLARRLWFARMEAFADWFIAQEATRRAHSQPVALEHRLSAQSSSPEITLRGVADRIDQDADGGYRLIDYKTGKPPKRKEQLHFDKQLLLEAAMLSRFGGGSLPAGPVVEATFVEVSRTPSEEAAPIDVSPPEQVWAEFLKLIRAYADESQGYTSRRAVQNETDQGDYDQLARYGEWDPGMGPLAEDVR